MLQRICLIPIIAALALSGCNRSSSASKTPRVIIISVDGLRPDLLLTNRTPNMHLMMKNGAYSMWARTTEISITLPSHTSMLTGVTPERHDIWWNSDIPQAKEHPPATPSIFELAHAQGYTTAMAVGKPKFETLLGPRYPGQPAFMDWSFVPQSQTNNRDVAEHAARIIHEHRPELLFIHFPDVDARGHASGWGSPPQREAIETADEGLGIVLNALRQEDLLDQTTIILSADHGGSGYGHGKEDFRSRYIPWIVTGPNVKHNLDLTTLRELVINTEDTFATASWLLGVPIDEDSDGKPITQAFREPARGELIVSARK